MLRPGVPISDATQDKLGRARFSKALAGAIASYADPNSLVVGLYGSWGTGKSSLLNMLESDLRATNGSLLLVRFNPWSYTDQSALLQHFLSDLAIRLQSSHSDGLKRAGKFIDDLTNLISPFASLVPYGSMANKAVKGIGSLLTARANKAGTVQAVKKNISEALRESASKIVVIIDDIDRLTSEEIRQVFQLVKSVADFSNVIYVLSFDKKLVIKALEDVQKGNGDSYLDKIVNIPFEIPRITHAQMRTLLDVELARFAEIDADYDWSTERLSSVLTYLSRQINTIRALDRFANVLDFTAALIKGEVDYIDFIALTALQISDPEAFEYLRDHADGFSYDDDGDIVGNKEAWEGLTAVARNQNTIGLASMVFPELESPTDEDDDESRFDRTSAVRNARACANSRLFDRYFQLVVPEDDVPRAQIREVLLATRNIEEASVAVAALRKSAGVRSALARLADSDYRRLQSANLGVLMHAVLRLFITSDLGVLRLHSSTASEFLVRLLLSIDEEERADILINLLQSDVGSATPLLNLIGDISRERIGMRGRSLSGPRDLSFTRTDIAKISDVATRVIRAALVSEPIAPWVVQDFRQVLLVWRTLGGLTVVRDFIHDALLKHNEYILSAMILGVRVPPSKRSIVEVVKSLDDYVDEKTVIAGLAGRLGITEDAVRALSAREVRDALNLLAVERSGSA